VKAFERSTPANAPNPRPELNMDWQLDAMTEDVIGVRLRTGEFLGANWGNSIVTYWYDRPTDTAFSSPGLLDGERGLRGVADLAREELGDRGEEVDQHEVTADSALFDSLSFNRNGDLVVEFDDCQVGPCSLGRVAVAVPARQVEPLLSAAGRRAQVQVREAATPAPTATPRVTITHSPEAASNLTCSVDCGGKRKCVALTFDDGPGPYTDRLLDVLREQDARATFFAVGTNAVAYPWLLRRMSNEGHLVGNHSWSHRDLSKLSTSKIADSLGRTQDMITDAIGQTPALMRPPYGAVDGNVRAVARKLGLKPVMWDVDPRDGSYRDPAQLADRVVRETRNGSVVLLHDIQRTTVDAVPDILKQLRGKGYSFVTVPELYRTAQRPGVSAP
ncbi:MAG: polysaccharide deacetylase family protein, partial [Catenulispora sp.]|nr:polysaccharide deacetylase family protein [Catenulispora sp.]